MFTGIITNIGVVEKNEFNEARDCLLAIKIGGDLDRDFDLGCSISCNGICLTLIEKNGDLFYFQASKESCEITTISDFKVGDKINIEFALRLGDEFGGHIVSGHVDDKVELLGIEKIQDSHKMRFSLAPDFAKFVVKKGSICLNGISLTVNNVGRDFFEVNIIDHSWKNTNLSKIAIGDFVNFEIDVIARYACANL